MGASIQLDFLTQDPFKTFIHYGHSKRNNEPFMFPLNEMDIAASHRRAGFEDVEILPFEEIPDGLSSEFTPPPVSVDVDHCAQARVDPESR